MITTRGYVILQNNITEKEKNMIKSELTITPIDLNSMIGGGGGKNDETRDFAIWRENPSKFYVPRFFGLKKWGIPPAINLPLGELIDVKFNGKLRPIQEPIVEKTLNHYSKNGPSGGGGALLELYCAIGKTVCALNLISQIKRKTIIIVHKEFLMNQWIERANEFLPGVRVGKIQGPIFDIEDKDIVIGMVQSMYDRDFPPGTFNSFGFAIFDEVHRFGSRQFSGIFWKFSTYYMLGITATINRKDGTTPLLSQFIGPIIYTITDRGKESVSVLGITYTDEKRGGLNAPYLKQETDFRGNTKYSTMIANVCNYKPRTYGIYTIVMNLLEKFPSSQLMILVHNLNFLNDMETIILEKSPQLSYGFYIGGMKKQALIDTETKQVVLASYSMAQEALDIKSLNILILGSSKTDIVQSVGRILRDKNTDRKIVVDIIDPNSTFENQWKKRLTYYKKCDYDVYKYNKWEDYINDPYSPFSGGDPTVKYNWKQLHPKPNKQKAAKCFIEESDDEDDDDEDDTMNEKKAKRECMIVF
jgi:superfamily II DNA or RNA helicase